ncbi:MAG: hypothetical protein ACKVIR_01500 [Candidatus Poseidoniales archaeon]
MSWDAEDVELVSLEWLKPHERIKTRNRDKLLDMTIRWGGFTKPLLVDSKSGAILDGHHRHSIAIELQLKRVPVIMIDYLADESVSVDVWPASGFDRLTKDDVIKMSLSDDLFPPKTSKHTIADDLPPIHVLLEVLKQES